MTTIIDPELRAQLQPPCEADCGQPSGYIMWARCTHCRTLGYTLCCEDHLADAVIYNANHRDCRLAFQVEGTCVPERWEPLT